jgi:hypothetical protein
MANQPINNLNLIKPLLNFSKKGDFYMLYILQRKKDQPLDRQNEHQSVRTIKSYSIDSLEYLDKRWNEIIQLAELFKARVYIAVNKQNHFDISLLMMETLAKRINSNMHNQKNLFDSVVGSVKLKEKRWIVDMDIKDLNELDQVKQSIDSIQPIQDESKVLETIPTPNGYHFITTKFDVKSFADKFPQHEIKKKNPTLLYYPKSLLNL